MRLLRLTPWLLVGLVALVMLAVGSVAQTPKQWDKDRVNVVRAEHHAAPVTGKYRLNRRAQRWSEHMAATGYLVDDTRARACWRIGGHIYGSNVGVGDTVRHIQDALERSPEHLDNIVERSFRWIGIGIATGHGAVWLTQEFCG